MKLRAGIEPGYFLRTRTAHYLGSRAFTISAKPFYTTIRECQP